MSVIRKEVMALTLLTLLSCSWIASGRYLPTRSDSTRREQIKELLGALLDLAPEDRDIRRSSYPYDLHSGSMAKRSVQEPERSIPFQRDAE
ncbi:uncharacterized protein [Parasteatoda tepidariorum]|uniref:Uncharacterized protein n=1 Tax=Parasteatoda tepidariorum TaxID=114398 RepID=A0A2L2XWM7_PARTP